MPAVRLAEEIAAATNLPYGGIYDHFNRMWIEGPFHRVIHGVDEAILASRIESTFASEGGHSTPFGDAAKKEKPRRK
jgi:hypothetical protein